MGSNPGRSNPGDPPVGLFFSSTHPEPGRSLLRLGSTRVVFMTRRSPTGRFFLQTCKILISKKNKMSKRKEPDSGCSSVGNRLTRSRSSPMLNESSFEIEALNDSNSADSAQIVDANRSSASPLHQQSPRNSTPRILIHSNKQIDFLFGDFFYRVKPGSKKR